jgi:hypothetical protein
VGFEITIPAFQRAKTIHVLDHAVTVIGVSHEYAPTNIQIKLKSLNLQMRTFHDDTRNYEYKLIFLVHGGLRAAPAIVPVSVS